MTQGISSSRFLDSLSQELLSCMLPEMEEVSLRRGEVLWNAGDVIEWVYFPLNAMISAVVVLSSGAMIEAQAVGNDGFAPMLLSIDLNHAETTAMVQIPGPALRIKADSFRRHLQYPELRYCAWSYMAGALRLLGQSTACIAFHPVQARLARWLLIVRDCTGRDTFPLTQDAMAAMLGVHRPTVTIAVRLLEAAGLVEHRRGQIHLVDPEALTSEACECYRLNHSTTPLPEE